MREYDRDGPTNRANSRGPKRALTEGRVGSATETDGFKRRGDNPPDMSTATKVVLTTVAVSALLSILLVFQNAFA
ncbi:hypothetical protein NJ7G_0463 [Natrinema sp. J7-2]|nr:hypothetical protein NJ7G_0463 [Natrinema sp. J7-2]